MRLRLLAAAVLLSAGVALHADTLASVAPDNRGNISAGYLGQSFTVLGSGGYSNIAFSFYTPTMTPFAVGTGYLYSQPYTGTGPSLSSAAPGYLGSAVASNGAYSFASITLTAGVQYYFLRMR